MRLRASLLLSGWKLEVKTDLPLVQSTYSKLGRSEGSGAVWPPSRLRREEGSRVPSSLRKLLFLSILFLCNSLYCHEHGVLKCELITRNNNIVHY